MKKNTLLKILSFVLLVFNTASAQVIEWQNTIGGIMSDNIYTIAPTADGGSICGGTSDSPVSGDKTENSQGLDDYWIVKLDAAGNIQWQNTIGGDSSDILQSIAQTADGGYICGGYTKSNISGDKTESCLGENDFWIVKLDAAGNIQWQNTIGGSLYDQLYSISQTPDGGYICGGISNSPVSGDKTEPSTGGFDNDYWILKLDAAGNIQWQNTIGGNSHDFLRAIDLTSDGGYICGGYSQSNASGDKTENNLGAQDYWVIKLDASGNIQWQNSIGANSSDLLYSISQTLDNGYICGGYSSSNMSGDKTENSMGYQDYWVVKLDAAGNVQWENTIGGSAADVLYSVFQAADGTFMCGGYSNSGISGDKTENSMGTMDYWVLKLDVAGNILWQNTIGGSGTDVLESIAPSSDGGFICGGRSSSPISGDKTENNWGVGWMDLWIVKLVNNWNFMTGNVFADINSNNLQDAGEPSLSNHRINEANTGRFTYSSQNGDYNLVIGDSGNFSVAPQGLNYYNAAPVQHTAYFPGFYQTDSQNNFALQPTAPINDLSVSISPPPFFRPGFYSTYQIHYLNAGTTVLSPTVILRKNSFLNYISSPIAPAGIAADSIVWNLPQLLPLQQGTISVTLRVAISTPPGTPINCYARIEPIAGDANPISNLGGWEPPLFVTGAIDPNAIVVNRDLLSTTELASSPFLQYIIYFQNTGNDTAFTVMVEDVLPVSLDASTMELIGLSHPGNVQYDPQLRKVEFRFNNILLPDSNVNEPESHGYIHYRIKPLTSLVDGDTVQNQAAIYFDYNLPVITNIATTQIVLPTGFENAEPDDAVLIYPNPAKGIFTIQTNSTIEKEIVITDLLGNTIFKSEIRSRGPGTKSEIDLSSQSKSIYLVKVMMDGKTIVKKIVLLP